MKLNNNVVPEIIKETFKKAVFWSENRHRGLFEYGASEVNVLNVSGIFVIFEEKKLFGVRSEMPVIGCSLTAALTVINHIVNRGALVTVAHQPRSSAAVCLAVMLVQRATADELTALYPAAAHGCMKRSGTVKEAWRDLPNQ